MTSDERPDHPYPTADEAFANESAAGLAFAPAEAPAEAPEVKARPVRPAKRVGLVDLIRGVAVLGILAMNVAGFAWPGSVYSIPTRDPDAGALDVALWAFNHLVFDTKMMTLFSMLFGAGLVLMSDRAEARGAEVRGVYFRRVLWLLVIGLVHAYLIWNGDVLVLYAQCGLFLYMFRNWKPRNLIITGVVFNVLLVPLSIGLKAVGLPYMERTAARVDAEGMAARTVGWWDQKMHDGWRDMHKPETGRREAVFQETVTYRGSDLGIVKDRAPALAVEHTLGVVPGGWWMAGGRMLTGMGLMKLGVFSGQCSRRFYLWMLGLGYGVGLPLMEFDVYHQVSHDFFFNHRMEYGLGGWPLLTLYGSVPVVFGHIAALVLLDQSGAFAWLTRRLQVVGRMALSSYLFDSLTCSTLFYGYGGDLFAAIHRPMVYLIVLAIWTTQLLVSPLWLETFRYGPAEWLWRSLTYWERPPFLTGAATT